MYVIFAYLHLFSCSFLFSTLNCCHCAGVLGVSMFETLVLSVVYVFFYTEPLFTKDMVTITVV